jgi:hypothetical protein
MSSNPDTPPVAEAVRNRKTGKLFLIVDDTLDKRYRVINPAGEVLVLPDILFEEDVIPVTSTEAGDDFTAEQIAAFTQFKQEEQERQKHAAQVAAQQAATPRRTVVEPAAAPRRARTPSKPKSNASGLVASWNAPKLTFYKHKIEPLAPKQSFRVTVAGVGVFEMTKDEFLGQFNDVVMSPSYRADGLYAYPTLPTKAEKFRRGDA